MRQPDGQRREDDSLNGQHVPRGLIHDSRRQGPSKKLFAPQGFLSGDGGSAIRYAESHYATSRTWMLAKTSLFDGYRSTHDALAQAHDDSNIQGNIC